MLVKHLILLIFLICSANIYGQNEELWQINLQHGKLKGSLICADTINQTPVILLIPGSGPTDRNGNNATMTNNAIKLLADSLMHYKISSLRIDKRLVGQSQFNNLSEKDLIIERYVQDLILWIKKLKNDPRFSKIIVAGHSQGALTGMLAVQKIPVDAYISISGAGRPIGEILRSQLKELVPTVKQKAYSIIDSLENGQQVLGISGPLYMIFRPSVQKFLISWMKYDPGKELAKLSVPVPIVQGTTDLQITVNDAKRLKKYKPESKLVIIEKMNHVLKEVESDRQENLQTYHQPYRALHPKLVGALVDFIKGL